ncbi:MAG: Rab family GTPase [Saprospiraceae bacterium]
MYSKKVILTGSFGVGKTSLFNRFIANTFNERYLTTIGVKVDKKEVTVNGQNITLILWDIAGEVTQDKVPTTYFLGTSAIIYVVDLTRPSTHVNIDDDINFLMDLLPNCLIKTVGNKADLLNYNQLMNLQQQSTFDVITSAKTGENVEGLFMDIASNLIGG